MLISLGIKELSDRTASQVPPPGGGSMAALSGLLGIGLLQMLINLSQQTPLLSAAGSLREKQTGLDKLRLQLLALVDRDAEVLAEILDIFRRTDHTAILADAEAQQRIQKAAKEPLQIAEACLEALLIGSSLVGKVPPHAAGDLVTAVLACRTGITGALLSTVANLSWLADAELVKRLEEKVSQMKKQADQAAKALEDMVYSRDGYQAMR
ncbi:hypothetical protein P22_3696 [Propionispora sp. 2/2-37]|uniref:cyclodeaminase/cyclohydrolase family protein n=1 Tax=Propionispora sp. 2/2-37 TaxID=1677858 RepID=UPI0006BB8C75|nr:cyclodeaminase/cyclohydrolase family protein [Propionispora sp. 2/2-37]CUH97565.1 hypothetical protein P22_3696 [Propionispora sp. 2/2-37]